MGSKDLKDEIIEVIRKVVSLRHTVDEIKEDVMLTGPPLEISAEELVYIVLELMDKYHIMFDRDDFEDYGFGTVQGITRAVEKHIM